MTITVTKIAGPWVEPGKGVGIEISILCDTVHATGGENVDLTSYLSYLYGASPQGHNAIADATRRFELVGPGYDTALTSTNVKLVVHHSSGADAVDNPADGEDLSTVGEIKFSCWGKAAIQTSWA